MQVNRSKFKVIGGEHGTGEGGEPPSDDTSYFTEKQLNDLLDLIKKRNPVSIVLILEGPDGGHCIESLPRSDFLEVGAIEWAHSINVGYLGVVEEVAATAE